MNKISVIIAAQKYPAHILDAVNSVSDLADEIVIIDIGLDQILIDEIIKNPIIRIIKIEEKIPYIELIREKSKKMAQNDYIFFLDPDEVVTSDLKRIIKKELGHYDYFKIPRKNLIFNQWIHHSGWWPDYQVRLFKKDSVIWPTQIHLQPKTAGKGITIQSEEKYALVHYNYSDLDDYLEKARRYARIEAENLLALNNRSFSLTDTVKKSLQQFISRFLALEGYKDGMAGLTLAFLQMFYYWQVYFYIWEKRKYETVPQTELIKNSRLFFVQGLKETNFWLIKKKLSSRVDNFKLKIINFFLRF